MCSIAPLKTKHALTTALKVPRACSCVFLVIFFSQLLSVDFFFLNFFKLNAFEGSPHRGWSSIARLRAIAPQAEPCTLAGTSDPEVMFRMGEDTRSCMGIQRACIKTNRGLLG